MPGRVTHFEVPYDDADRAASFYREIFDWEVQPMPELDYTFVSTGPTGDDGPTEPGYIGGGMYARAGDASPNPVIVIEGPDIDATLSRIEANGGSTVVQKTPVADMGFSAYFSDSEGNLMGLWQSA